MSKEINLSPQRRKDVVEKQERLRVFRNSSISFFTFIVIAILGVFLLNIFSPVNQLKKDKALLVSQLRANDEKISKYEFITSRVQDISDIITKRTSYTFIMQELNKNLPESMTIESLKINEKNVTVITSSSSLSSINSFIDALVGLTTTTDMYDRAVLKNLASDPSNGRFSASIVLGST